jgi:hypothetical protein
MKKSLDNEEALDEEDIGGAGETDWLNGGKMEGLKMGCHSGYLGVKGRRTKSSPFSTNFSTNSKHHTPFFFRCPKSSDLSLKPSQSSVSESWPIHVKTCSNLSIETIVSLAKQTPYEKPISNAHT